MPLRRSHSWYKNTMSRAAALQWPEASIDMLIPSRTDAFCLRTHREERLRADTVSGCIVHTCMSVYMNTYEQRQVMSHSAAFLVIAPYGNRSQWDADTDPLSRRPSVGLRSLERIKKEKKEKENGCKS